MSPHTTESDAPTTGGRRIKDLDEMTVADFRRRNAALRRGEPPPTFYAVDNVDDEAVAR